MTTITNRQVALEVHIVVVVVDQQEHIRVDLVVDNSPDIQAAAAFQAVDGHELQAHHPYHLPTVTTSNKIIHYLTTD